MPPPPPGPPPPPVVSNSAPPPASKDRNALLGQIQKGAKLKKAVTVDKSKPVIEGACRFMQRFSINGVSSKDKFSRHSFSRFYIFLAARRC
jgi:hypothetical protein